MIVSLVLSVVLSAAAPGFHLQQIFVDRVDVLAVSIESGYAAFRVVTHQESMLEDSHAGTPRAAPLQTRASETEPGFDTTDGRRNFYRAVSSSHGVR